MTKAKMAGRNNVSPLQKTRHDLHVPTWLFIQRNSLTQQQTSTCTYILYKLHIVLLPHCSVHNFFVLRRHFATGRVCLCCW